VIFSKESFQQDPIRILRAIKWNFAGYKSTTDLIEVVKNWQPSNNFNNALLNAVARKHVLGFNKEQQYHYLRLLNDYGLAKKLFFCLPEAKRYHLPS
jgi:tRNA nucleotidyltransferase/poly(A) polymerase